MENLHKLIDAMVSKLFAPEARRIENRVADLDKQNGEIRRAREYGFQWKGSRFYVAGAPFRVTKLPSLDFALRNMGDDLLRDIAAVEDDKQMVRQVMALLLKSCTSSQDIRDALPDPLVELSDELLRLPRMREAGHTLTDERQIRQYRKMLDTLDFYAATRMMY